MRHQHDNDESLVLRQAREIVNTHRGPAGRGRTTREVVRELRDGRPAPLGGDLKCRYAEEVRRREAAEERADRLEADHFALRQFTGNLARLFPGWLWQRLVAAAERRAR